MKIFGQRWDRRFVLGDVDSVEGHQLQFDLHLHPLLELVPEAVPLPLQHVRVHLGGLAGCVNQTPVGKNPLNDDCCIGKVVICSQSGKMFLIFKICQAGQRKIFLEVSKMR